MPQSLQCAAMSLKISVSVIASRLREWETKRSYMQSERAFQRAHKRRVVFGSRGVEIRLSRLRLMLKEGWCWVWGEILEGQV